MKIAVFDTHPYDQQRPTTSIITSWFFFEPRLTIQTVELAAGFDAVCPFVNCRVDERVLTRLKALEEGVFFQDLSNEILSDDMLARLLTYPNVLITSHQGFLTHEALAAIAETTLVNASIFEQGQPLMNEVRLTGAGAALPR